LLARMFKDNGAAVEMFRDVGAECAHRHSLAAAS
jgi:hypothetical protein